MSKTNHLLSQVRPSPIKLLDATQSGYQRFLVLYLVEPSSRIISTANIRLSKWIGTAIRYWV